MFYIKQIFFLISAHSYFLDSVISFYIPKRALYVEIQPSSARHLHLGVGRRAPKELKEWGVLIPAWPLTGFVAFT